MLNTASTLRREIYCSNGKIPVTLYVSLFSSVLTLHWITFAQRNRDLLNRSQCDVGRFPQTGRQCSTWGKMKALKILSLVWESRVHQTVWAHQTYGIFLFSLDQHGLTSWVLTWWWRPRFLFQLSSEQLNHWCRVPVLVLQQEAELEHKEWTLKSICPHSALVVLKLPSCRSRSIALACLRIRPPCFCWSKAEWRHQHKLWHSSWAVYSADSWYKC